MDDNEIVGLYLQRSETAISETAAKYSRYCRRIAVNILGNDGDAEECVNDTYMRVWNAIPPANPSRLSTFLGKITRNLALNMYEKSRAEKRGGGQTALALSELEECISGGFTPETLTEDALITEALNAFLGALNTTHRAVFVRRYWYLSSIEDICAEFGMSAAKVKSLLFRLRKKLKAALEMEGIEI